MTQSYVKKSIDLKIAEVDQVKDAGWKIQRFPRRFKMTHLAGGRFENTYLLLRSHIFTQYFNEKKKKERKYKN